MKAVTPFILLIMMIGLLAALTGCNSHPPQPFLQDYTPAFAAVMPSANKDSSQKSRVKANGPAAVALHRFAAMPPNKADQLVRAISRQSVNSKIRIIASTAPERPDYVVTGRFATTGSRSGGTLFYNYTIFDHEGAHIHDIGGHVRMSGSRGDPWAAAGDDVFARAATQFLEEFSAFLDR